MFYNLEDENPLVLLIAEQGLKIPGLIADYFAENSIETKQIYLDQNFFSEYETQAKEMGRIYKIVLVYGYYSNSSEIYEKIFHFLEILREKQTEKIPIILVSQFVSSLELLDDFIPDYSSCLNKQKNFLSDFLIKFGDSLVFLSQDLLFGEKRIGYPLLLFLSAIKQDHLFDLQAKFYFQDEKSFIDLIKSYLVKPHQSNKFLVRGKAESSEKIVKKIAYLYEQYFQKKASIIKLFSDEKRSDFIGEFSKVSNSKSQTEDLIDEVVREIPNIDENMNLIAPSELELKKALEAHRLKLKAKENQKISADKNRLAEFNISHLLNSSNETDKAVLEVAKEDNFSDDLSEKIEGLFSTLRKKEKINRQKKNIKQGQEIIKKSKSRKIVFWFGIAGFSFGSVLLALLFSFNFSKNLIKEKLYDSVKNDYYDIEKTDKSIIYRFFKFQTQQYVKAFGQESLTDASDLIRLNDVLFALSLGKDEAQRKFLNLYKASIGGGAELSPIYDELIAASEKENEAEKNLNSYLMDLNLDLYQGEEKNTWQNSLEKNKIALKNSFQTQKFLANFKEFILQPGRVNMLVLIQDSSELRSTGGFLTEVVLLSFEKGALIDKQVLDINDLDSRVYGLREADPEIKEILGESNLHLRDSNWQADFIASNDEIKSFIEQIMGTKIDFTIALNTKSVIEMLRVLNELKLDDQSLITAANYLEKQEKTAALDYKNIGNAKFTWQFINALLDKTLDLNQDQLLSFSNVFISQLNQREILFQANNQKLQQTIVSNSWSGEKINPTCPAEFKQGECLLDSIYQVENNVGINKVNPYIKETIEHNLGISKDFIRHKRKITYENFSKTDIWPLGSYKNYLKFYLNPQASLEKMELNGKKIEEQQIKILDTQRGREVSYLLEIPKQSKVELTITYLVPNQDKLPFSYVFFDQKQPGIFAKETFYNIVFDESFKPQLIAPQATYQDKIIRFENKNLDHFLFAINFNQ